jgi:hypothetical protein
MENSMLVIKANDDVAKITFLENEKPKLEQMQEIVGGYIEVVYIPYLEQQGDYLAIVDEEGMIRRRMFNKIMNTLFGVHLYGDVIIMNKGDLE